LTPDTEYLHNNGAVARRVVISQGEVWWVEIPAPTGSGPAFAGCSSWFRGTL
jgi:hypothetical protein